jgi:RNA polymerase sigma-70 factor (ECF subfamily)
MSAIGQHGSPHSAGLDLFLAEYYARARCAEFGLSSEQFAAILEEVATKAQSGKMPSERRNFYATLHLEDLVLARACGRGNERAWEVFMLRFREKLYDVAAYITRETSTARELADSVYADLYGTRTREGERVSKLNFYTGRGSLEGWLRTVLAQEFVNSYRARRRLVSLDEETEDGAQFPAPPAQDSRGFADSRLEEAVHEELRALGPHDRFILASYFLDQRTLAEIGRALGVHESTVSRRVEKLTRKMRKQIIRNLAQRGMDRAAAEEALGTDVRDLVVDVRASLAQDSVGASFREKTAKAQEGGS